MCRSMELRDISRHLTTSGNYGVLCLRYVHFCVCTVQTFVLVTAQVICRTCKQIKFEKPDTFMITWYYPVVLFSVRYKSDFTILTNFLPFYAPTFN